MKEILNIDSVSQVHKFFQLRKPMHPLVSVLRINNPVSDFDFEKYRFVINLFQISFKSHASQQITYGRNKYDFEEGTMIFTGVGQVLEFENNQTLSDGKGWSLVFHPDLIRKSQLGKNIEKYSFFSYDSNEALHVSDEEKKSIEEIVGKIEREYSQNIDKHSQLLIISNIELLLNYCIRFYDRQFYTRTNLNQDTVSKFERLLNTYFKSNRHLETGLPTVNYCGEQMNMSPNYLSDLLKKETGKNAKEHIHLYLIEMSKNLLLNSEKPIAEIAYDLGFEYPNHFSKLFKTKVGVTPSKYRNLN